MRENTTVLLVLIALTIGSYLFYDSSLPDNIYLVLLLAFACIKVLLVVYFFMELRKAHMAWLIIISLVIVIYMGVVLGN